MPSWEELYAVNVEHELHRGNPLKLQPNRLLRPRTALDAQIALDFGGLNTVITTPNANEIPQFPHIAGRRIVTRVDGLWGPQEYSRWPQQYHPDVVHHACIPRIPAPDDSGPGILIFLPLKRQDFDVPPDTWPYGYGYVSPDKLKALTNEVNRAISRFEHSAALVEGRVSRIRHGFHLVNLLHNSLQRLQRIPSSFLHAVAVYAHVQRLVLELTGLCTYINTVRPRLQDPGYSAVLPLDVRGAFINEPAVAQELYRVGIPFWLFQPYMTDILIVTVATHAQPISSTLLLEPAFAGVDSSLYDPSGTCQDPSRWPAAMILQTSMNLASPSLPSLLPSVQPSKLSNSISGHGPPVKRLRVEGSRAAEDTCCPARGKKRTHRSGRSRGTRQRAPHPAFAFCPPPSTHPQIPGQWHRALADIKALPNPPAHAATYFFPPPFLLEAMDAKTGRYLHNWLRIRNFARQRLVDVFIRGDPLRIDEWRDALYGEYRTPNTTDPEPVPLKQYSQSERAAFERKTMLRRLFAGAGGLPSYDPSCAAHWRDRIISADEARDDIALRAAVVWELHEVNWRCELRELDRLMLGKELGLNAFLQWERADLVSLVWSSRGAFSVFPDYPDQPAVDLWLGYPWHGSRARIAALLKVMSRWPSFPQHLWQHVPTLADTDDERLFRSVESDALGFYVLCFTNHFGRLPIPPAHPAHLVASLSL